MLQGSTRIGGKNWTSSSDGMPILMAPQPFLTTLLLGLRLSCGPRYTCKLGRAAALRPIKKIPGGSNDSLALNDFA